MDRKLARVPGGRGGGVAGRNAAAAVAGVHNPDAFAGIRRGGRRSGSRPDDGGEDDRQPARGEEEEGGHAVGGVGNLHFGKRFCISYYHLSSHQSPETNLLRLFNLGTIL